MHRNTMIAIASVAILFVTCTRSMNAQCKQYILPNGDTLTCTVDVNGSKVYTDGAGNVYPATPAGPGSGTFVVTNSSTEPCQAEFAVVDLNVESKEDQLGTITTRADLKRDAKPSTIVSNAGNLISFLHGRGGAQALPEADEFPATEDLYFYATATISSKPGKTYRSDQEIHLRSENVNSFNPHINETFKLTEGVDFREVLEDGTVSDEIAYTLTSATVVLNGAPGK
ncbi:MAG TPA: hypothetical protein VHI13_14450 [Candidatus Kapabacteria bacterium]|nr:hypothetical protein [Candidatus Kapabacteria bacterium]